MQHKSDTISYRFIKKILSLIIVTLLIFSPLIVLNKNFFTITVSGATLYVDPSGGSNYTSIQEAINNAGNGDTVIINASIYYENVIVNKSITLQGENKNLTIIDGSSNYGIYIQSNNTIINNMTITNCTSIFTGFGMIVNNSSFIIQNVVLDNLTIYSNAYGAYLNNATNCTVKSCNIYSNTILGLNFQNSPYNTLQNNIFTNNGLTMSGLQLNQFIHTINGNTVNSKSLIYYNNQTNIIVDSEAGQIILANCTNIAIRNITINNTNIGAYAVFSNNINISNCTFDNAGIQLYYTNNSKVYSNNIYDHTSGDGINLPYSNNNTISSNYIYNNGDDGIQFTASNNNTIISNSIYNNSQGFALSSSNNNTIYNNNFNNTNNCIDDGTNFWNTTKVSETNIIEGPYIGGNYWNDYNGMDIDHDGLGNTLIPYNSSNNITTGGDYYPLIISPSVSGNSPTGSSASVSANIVITFNKAMNQTFTQNNFSISPSISGSYSWTYSNKTLTFNPSSDLEYNTQYTVTIKWNATDTSGNMMPDNYSWSFTTEISETPEEPGDGFDLTDNPPSISNILHIPTTVTSEDTVIIYASVSDDYSVQSVVLYWNDGSVHTKSMSLSDGNYSTTIGPFPELTTVTYWINATDNTSQSTESSTYTFTVPDTSGPTITIKNPISGSTIYDTTPVVKAFYSDPSGINTSSIGLSVDGSNITAQTKTSSFVAYTPNTAMTYGDHSVKLWVSDTLGNTSTKEWSFTIEEVESITEEELGNITLGETNEVIPENKEETGIEVIRFIVNTNLTNVKISVAKLIGKPEDITEAPINKTIYTYLFLEIIADDTFLDEENIENLTINFKVNVSWIESNSINKTTITLLRYKDGQWQELNTTITDEDSIYVYFEAISSGLSTFAIVGQTIDEESPTTELPAEIDYALIVGVVVAIIILIIFILFKTGFLYVEKVTEESNKDDPSEIKWGK